VLQTLSGRPVVELVWLVKLALQNKLIIIKKRRRWWIGKALPYEARKSAFLDYALGGECDVEFRAVSISGMLEQLKCCRWRG